MAFLLSQALPLLRNVIDIAANIHDTDYTTNHQYIANVHTRDVINFCVIKSELSDHIFKNIDNSEFIQINNQSIMPVASI